MKKISLITICLILCGGLSSSVFAFEGGARGYYWFPVLDGTVKVDEAAVLGSNIDFELDLGMDDEAFPSVEAFAGIGKHHASLVYTRVDYSGNKTLTRDISFSGQTYSISDDVTSTLQYDMVDFYYQYDLWDINAILAGLTLGGVVHVKYLDGEVCMKTSLLDEKEKFSVPVPMVGLNAHLGVLADILEARIRGTGMTYSSNTMYELLGEISWTPFPLVDIHGGYKMFVTNVDEDDVDFDYDMSGAFVALTVSF